MLKSVFLTYILMPLIAFLLIGLMAVVKRKNALVSNKKLIIFVLLYSLAMCLPGFLSFAGGSFVPWLYLVAQVYYLLMGAAFVQLYSIYFQPDVKKYEALFQAMLLLVIMALSAYLFALLYNVGSTVGGGYMAATAMVIVPLPVVFYRTYLAFINIPYEIYKVWHYPAGSSEINFEGLDFNTLMVLDLEFSREPDDRNRLQVKAKAPPGMIFGEWYKKFIDDFNTKSPNQAIAAFNGLGDAFGWVFYCKRSFFHRRRLLDPGLTIQQNRIREHVTITSKRVIEHSEEKFYTNNQLI